MGRDRAFAQHLVSLRRNIFDLDADHSSSLALRAPFYKHTRQVTCRGSHSGSAARVISRQGAVSSRCHQHSGLAAHLARRTFSDKAGDTGTSVDITTVKVANGSGGGARIAVRAKVGQLTIFDFYTFWFDTASLDAGPEYKVVVNPDSDGIQKLRVLDEFGEKGPAVRCDGLRARADTSGPAEVSASVPRYCLGDPGKVRVSLRGRYVNDGHQVTDWAPRERKFFSWVEL